MKRFRELRKDQATRDKYADVSLSAADFIYPYFVVEGENQKEEISTMPGIYRFSIDTLLKDIEEIKNLGINKVLLFGVIPDEQKDERGSAAYADDALIARAVKAIKAEFGKDIIVFTDVCLCEYTSHGHCGLLHHHDVDNDSTLPLLAEEAYVHAKAGADFVAPSAMMDGQVEAIKNRLREGGLDKQCKVLAYSAKYASAFYGPFRDAADSAPSFGDRKSYQMDFRTHDQGLDEIAADIEEGADWTMVKPAMPYLDMIARGVEKFPNIPMVAYQVSGEYSMLKAAAKLGYLDESRVAFESLIAIKRAGAQYIITYYAKEIIEKAEEKSPVSPFGVTCLNLALGKTGQMGDRMFEFYQNGTEGLLPEFRRDFTSPLPTSEAYYHLGMVNTAQRFTFEAMEAIPNFNKSGRCFKRLAETNLINGQYEVAAKYLRLLRKTIFYRDWAEDAMTYLYNEEKINAHKEWGWLRQMRYTEDFLFSNRETDIMLGLLYQHNHRNRMAFEYMLAYVLQQRDLERFMKYYPLGKHVGYDHIPRSYQEALVYVWTQTHKNFQGMPWSISPQVVRDVTEFARIYTSQQDARPVLQARFGSTYWNYLLLRK